MAMTRLSPLRPLLHKTLIHVLDRNALVEKGLR